MKKKWLVASMATALAVLMALMVGCSSGQASSGSASSSNGSASASASSSSSNSVSASASSSAAASADKAPDYSQKSCWYQVPEITKDVDTFFIYPTEYLGSNEGDAPYASLDNPDMVAGAANDHKIMASAFEDSTNLFMPYYRQSSAINLKSAYDKTGDIRTALTGTPYEDITAALDYYFENYNDGRPFIIASHSQGSAINTLVLEGYFKEHPEYYERMVAAYVIGFSVTKDELEANPHLKFATGEADTGVVVSWHTEGPKNVEQNSPTPVLLSGGISINPLNWKLDDTYAPASENLGSLVIDAKAGAVEIRDIGADAQVVPSRGTVVTNANIEPKEAAELFGPQGYHEDDYAIYYNNVKENVAKRVAAYKASH